MKNFASVILLLISILLLLIVSLSSCYPENKEILEEHERYSSMTTFDLSVLSGEVVNVRCETEYPGNRIVYEHFVICQDTLKQLIKVRVPYFVYEYYENELASKELTEKDGISIGKMKKSQMVVIETE